MEERYERIEDKQEREQILATRELVAATNTSNERIRVQLEAANILQERSSVYVPAVAASIYEANTAAVATTIISGKHEEVTLPSQPLPPHVARVRGGCSPCNTTSVRRGNNNMQ
jgi:hypothetical protein